MKKGIKLVFLGESTTGKTTLSYRIARDEFYPHSESTIGASFLTTTMDNQRYDIWDTAGQERYLGLMPMYYRNSDILLFVYDLTNPKSVHRFEHYLKDIVLLFTHGYRIIFIGNKLDICTDDNVKKSDVILDKIISEFKLDPSMYSRVHVSAKTGEKSETLKHEIEKFGKELSKTKVDLETSITFDDSETKESKYCCQN